MSVMFYIAVWVVCLLLSVPFLTESSALSDDISS